MEDPGYTPAKILFELAGAYVTSIPVDEQGLDVEQLNKSLPSAKLVYVTPSSQFPLRDDNVVASAARFDRVGAAD